MPFATAAVHNSYYFHKYDNTITKRDEVVKCFKELIHEFKVAVQNSIDGSVNGAALVGGAVSEEALWSCTTCGAC